jgi:hypothetical protein
MKIPHVDAPDITDTQTRPSPEIPASITALFLGPVEPHLIIVERLIQRSAYPRAVGRPNSCVLQLQASHVDSTRDERQARLPD